MASKNTTREQERFEEEVDRLADERDISFSAALALKTGGAPRPPKEKKQVTRKDFEELWGQSTRDLEMLCGREFRRQLDSGEVERVAAERGVPYQDAFARLQDEAYRPLTEAEERRREARQRAARRTLEVDEEALDKKATTYADKHGVGYEVALEAVLDTVPGSRRPVELAEPEKLKVDSDEEKIDRRVQAHAAKHNVAYEVALEAVLTEGR